MVLLPPIETGKMKQILAFAGSNSANSINHQTLEILSSFFELDYELISLRDYEAPLFGVDLKDKHGVPDRMRDLHQKMKSADGFVLSAAEHNGSMTAVLKNTFDWLSILEPKFFLFKPLLILSVSPGGRGARSCREHLVNILPHRGAIITGDFGLPNFKDNVANGVIEESYMNQIIPLIRGLEQHIKEKK